MTETLFVFGQSSLLRVPSCGLILEKWSQFPFRDNMYASGIVPGPDTTSWAPRNLLHAHELRQLLQGGALAVQNSAASFFHLQTIHYHQSNHIRHPSLHNNESILPWPTECSNVQPDDVQSDDGEPHDGCRHEQPEGPTSVESYDDAIHEPHVFPTTQTG